MSKVSSEPLYPHLPPGIKFIEQLSAEQRLDYLEAQLQYQAAGYNAFCLKGGKNWIHCTERNDDPVKCTPCLLGAALNAIRRLRKALQEVA